VDPNAEIDLAGGDVYLLMLRQAGLHDLVRSTLAAVVTVVSGKLL
jgi:hypothetical protein